MKAWSLATLAWGAALLASADPAAAHDEKAEAYPLACSYAPKKTGDFDRFEHCAKLDGDTAVLAPRHLAATAFHDGLAEVAVGKDWYYVRRDGRALRVLTFDNGPDPFAWGLTRSRVTGKIGFFDHRLKLAFTTDFDWVSPLDENGYAMACRGCTLTQEAGGEHSFYTGGEWGAIDRRGRIVVPVTPASNEVMKRLPELIAALPPAER